MRQLLCEKCGTRHVPGRRRLYATSASGEPAEYERVAHGLARTATVEQRTVRINGEPTLLDAAYYECDVCAEPIAPGDVAVAWTVWTDRHGEPAVWEHEYLTHERE